MGHLPQGAPTSPKIANLVARDLDKALAKFADTQRLTYTRYADDLTFSTTNKLNRSGIPAIIGSVCGIIADHGFSPNTAKTAVSSPSARKIVLGLLVDQNEPRLTREFKLTLRQHLYYLGKYGPAAHASHNGNATTFGIRNHVLGLIQHARQIEPSFGEARLKEFEAIQW